MLYPGLLLFSAAVHAALAGHCIGLSALLLYSNDPDPDLPSRQTCTVMMSVHGDTV